MAKLLKSDREILDKFGGQLNEAAQEELARIWGLRDKFTSINEVTLPILAQYVAVQDKVQLLSYQLDEADEAELPEIIDNISKLQKVLIAYSKLLKLDEKIVQKSTNKFAELLLK